jgi:cutinase
MINQGNFNQGGTGGATLAADVTQALAQCPNTKIVISGYSQGGLVVHNALNSQGLSATQVSAAVLFGDEGNGQALGNLNKSKVLEICASGDYICNGSGVLIITSAHISYGANADQAAQYVISTLGL